MTITRSGNHFKDEHGRVRILRGVNLSGTSKVPTHPNGATHLKEGFFDHRDVSFIGRPFPLEDADEHFRRLKAWGLTFLRFIVTWEAVEHQEPGQYDEAYLDYVGAILDKAAEYDMLVFIDFHQDVWSRFSGGDGAPGWTLEKVGLDMRHFNTTGAALVHQEIGDPFPRMIWATNYTKLAAATMFTIFYAGNDFAPNTQIDGMSAQDYLQTHYFNMLTMVARRFRDKPNVIGYDLMNEPSKGFIGLKHLGKTDWQLKMGDMPTPFQAMVLGAGYPQTVQHWHFGWTGMRRVGREQIDPQGVSAWREGVEPIWKAHGVWDLNQRGEPVLLEPDYFHKVGGQSITFENNYMRPFITRASHALHAGDPDTMSFVEFDAMGRQHIPVWDKRVVDEQRIVYAPHWYPFIALMSKRYISWVGLDAVRSRPVFGRDAKRIAYASNLKYHRHIAQKSFHGVPTIIGEIGIPYDLNDREGYTLDKWDAHIKAIDDYMYALETNLLHYTIWNYSPDNTNERGDQWNGEDLSIFSYDQQDDPDDINSGGRALIALVRPYAYAIAGTPEIMHFDLRSGTFTLKFTHDKASNAPTEIYVPNLQYPQGFTVTLSDGDYEHDADTQIMRYYHSDQHQQHELKIIAQGQRDILEDERRNIPFMAFSTIATLLVTFALFFRRDPDRTD
ncbi:MAG: cellulase family glycosylhydrolase [Anaerolineae bacterium]